MSNLLLTRRVGVRIPPAMPSGLAAGHLKSATAISGVSVAAACGAWNSVAAGSTPALPTMEGSADGGKQS